MVMVKKWYHDFITWGYIRYGMAYGDVVSYLAISGSADQFERRFMFFESRYIKLGYIPVDFDHFVAAGGYRGRKYLEPYLLRKVNDTN